MSKSVKVLRLPDCDTHQFMFKGEAVPLAMYDAKTQHGPWANMCQKCFDVEGIGLGTGVGQRLVESRVCPVCKEMVPINNDETLRRHAGKTEFDKGTDGICSGSNYLVG